MKTLAVNIGLTIGLSATLAGLHSPVSAAPVNLTSWLAFGDTLVTANSARVTTAFFSESRIGSGALDIDTLESLLNTASGTLGLNAYEGSALSQSFNLNTNALLSFSWTLATDVFDAGFADLAFVLIDNTLIVPLATASATELSGGFNYSFSPGSHTIAFGVVDVNDVAGVSSFNVSNVILSAVTSTVPEPGSLALILAAIGIAGYTTWQSRGGGKR